MNCNAKTMIKLAAGLGLLAVVGYFTVPQFRTLIVGIFPLLLTLLCPLSMIFMMKGMNSHQPAPERKPEPAQAPQLAGAIETKAEG